MTVEIDIYEKARRMGLDERQIALAKQIDCPVPQQQAQLEAQARVAIHALAYDHPGEALYIDRYGIGYTPHPDGSATVWTRSYPHGVFVRRTGS